MAEFDRYARDYSELLKDPVRDWFTSEQDAFFATRKFELLTDFLAGQELAPERMAWLDVGCGKGDLLACGAGRFARTVGCDVSAEMLSACAGVEVVRQNDPARLPFGDTEFDLVTEVCVYHHVAPENRTALTAELFRVLRPGGVACIIEHNPFNPATRLIVSRTPVDADAKLLSARSARRLLSQAGGCRLETRHFLFFPATLYSKWKGVEAKLTWLPCGGQYAVFARKSGGG